MSHADSAVPVHICWQDGCTHIHTHIHPGLYHRILAELLFIWKIHLITHIIPWLTSAICESYWLFLPRMKINIALAKLEGRDAHAWMLPLFWQPFFSLALYHCAAKFFFAFLLQWYINYLTELSLHHRRQWQTAKCLISLTGNHSCCKPLYLHHLYDATSFSIFWPSWFNWNSQRNSSH